MNNFILKSFEKTDLVFSGTIEKKNKNIKITWILKGDLGDVDIPEMKYLKNRGVNLWEQTCFEVFIKEKNKKEYLEFNFTPDGFYDVLVFSDYREKIDQESNMLAIDYHWEYSKDLLKLEAMIDFNNDFLENKLCLGASAILFQKDGSKNHWALFHPVSSRPDFHDTASFLIEI